MSLFTDFFSLYYTLKQVEAIPTSIVVPGGWSKKNFLYLHPFIQYIF